MSQSIERHKAAIRRHEHSLPVKCLVRDQLVTTERGLFDYGCGHGDDLAGLQAEGIECSGFDPAFRPDAPRLASPVVNLGFVLNVIEDVAERAETLKTAWRLAEQVLCVAARILVSDQSGGDVEYGDGVLTRIGTFQKYFTQAELRQYLEETLEEECFPAAPGVYYVFRDKELKSTYLASKYRRRIAAPRKRIAEVRYEEHRDILDALIEAITELGRLPEPDEFAASEPVIEVFGSLKRAFALIRRVTSDDDWEVVRKQRSEDSLVYLALANFGQRPKFSELSRKFQRDVKAFFTSYKNACEQADQLMFRAGDPDEIDAACERSTIGRLCPSSLWIHESVRDQLEPLLRIYEGCARAYIGSVEDAILIKLHRFSGKVSYLACPNFESDPHPITTETTKVWLRTLRVGFYETESRTNPPLLDRKDQMLDTEDERRAKFERLTKQEFKHGLLHEGDDFLTRSVWQGNLQMLGFAHRGHRLVKASRTSAKPKALLPKRCGKFGVGKRIGGAVYVHRQYEGVLGESVATAKAKLPSGFDYTVVKHNELNGNVSFIHCPDFDTADEPSTGDYAVVRSDGVLKLHSALADPYIYHHKWLFVAEDYQGFDVSQSQQRSAAWMSLDNVDKSLIGRASYWKREVMPRLTRACDEGWLRSEEIRKRLKLTTCELAHMREAGELRFKKQGNAYLYRPPGSD
ncbi:DNA phosphorothioation-associated putative methyltransferase [Rhodopirellula baltica]|nr:DNA phosphorothioation-associated putative methyltransferase [Rhodopirellula baltica]